MPKTIDNVAAIIIVGVLGSGRCFQMIVIICRYSTMFDV